MFKEIHYTTGSFFLEERMPNLRGVCDCCGEILTQSFKTRFGIVWLKLQMKIINNLFKFRKQALKFKNKLKNNKENIRIVQFFNINKKLCLLFIYLIYQKNIYSHIS